MVKEKQELTTTILYDNIHKDKIREKIKELMEFDKKYKTYTSDGRENFSIEYFKVKTLQEILEEE